MNERGLLDRQRLATRGRALISSVESPIPSVRLEKDWCVQLEDPSDPTSIWLLTHTGLESEKFESFVYSIVRESRYNREGEDHSLKRTWRDWPDKQLLFYGPFITDWLYLSRFAFPRDLRAIDRAARLSRFFLRYWEQQAERDESEALLVLPMAKRTYWRSLACLIDEVESADSRSSAIGSDASYEEARAALAMDLKRRRAQTCSSLSSWVERIDLKSEYLHTTHEWQQICMEDKYAGFFIEILAPWLGKDPDDWQQLREDELKSTLWPTGPAEPTEIVVAGPDITKDRTRQVAAPVPVPAIRESTKLDAPLMTTLEGRARLKILTDVWFLPRYDLGAVVSLRRDTDKHAKDSQWRWHWKLVEPYGLSRLWAGILLGYLVTMFQGDTWKFLERLAIDRPWMGACFVLLLVTAVCGVLWIGVWQRTGLRSKPIRARRVANMMIRGELFALLAGIIVLVIAGPILEPESGTLANWNYWSRDFSLLAAKDTLRWILLLVMYAQVAMFIGVFTHLIFDERSATEPLSGP